MTYQFIIISVVLTWLVSQCLKMIIAGRPTIFFEHGGMPSSHAAFVSALATAVGLVEGWTTTLFLVTLSLAILVIHDAGKRHQSKEIAVGTLLGILGVFLIRLLV